MTAVTGTLLGAASQADDAPPVIVVHVQSFAQLPRSELQPAIDPATRAFRGVGIHVDWRAGVAAVHPGELTLVDTTVQRP